jgi:hypothetical protein
MSFIQELTNSMFHLKFERRGGGRERFYKILWSKKPKSIVGPYTCKIIEMTFDYKSWISIGFLSIWKPYIRFIVNKTSCSKDVIIKGFFLLNVSR